MTRAARIRVRDKRTGQYVGDETPGASQPAYEAASYGRRLRHWTPPEIGPNAALQFNLTTLRNRVRDQVRNNAVAARASDAFVSNLVGTGIKPLSRVRDEAFRERLQDLWNQFATEVDAQGQLDFYGLEGQIARAWFEGGECFVRKRVRRRSDGLRVPLQLQVLEAEHLPVEKSEIANNGNVIQNGIEFDAIGRRVAYHMYRVHPGDRHGFEFLNQQNPTADLTTRVPADEILHVFLPMRPGSQRGEPRLTQALLRLQQLDQWNDAELERQRMASMFLGIVQKASEGDVNVGTQDAGASADAGPEVDVQTLEPGTLMDLRPGEQISWSDPPEVGDNYERFVRHQLRAIAQSAGVLYEQLTGDYGQINDRTYRAAHNELRRQIEMLQQTVLVPQLCRPVWRWFFDVARSAGVLQVPSSIGVDQARRVTWVPQGFRYIHPVQDVQAERGRVRSGFKSRMAVATEAGEDVHEIDEQNRRDRERERELGLVYDTDPSQVSQSGGAHGENAGFDTETDAAPDGGGQQGAQP